MTTTTELHFDTSYPLVGLPVRVRYDSHEWRDAPDYFVTGTLVATLCEDEIWVVERDDDEDGTKGDIWVLPENVYIADPFTDLPRFPADLFPTDRDESDQGFRDL